MNMKKIKSVLIASVLTVFLLAIQPEVKSQVFYIGFNGGAAYSWFNSPGVNNYVTSSGYGWDLGFFVRYGKRPFYQLGFDWTRSNNDFVFEIKEADFKIEDKVPFHNFDFSVKVGYEIIQKPYFKWSVLGGPFLGRSFLFNSNEFEFSNTDFIKPQYGIIGGTGIQVTNFILSLEYSYHISGLFKPVEADGQTVDFGSKLQIVSVKVGMQF
jgi:hypothetical protein